jgi:hypothetical protein
VMIGSVIPADFRNRKEILEEWKLGVNNPILTYLLCA